MKPKYPSDWVIEDTGGGCQWLRKGQIAITDGEAGLPEWGKPCAIVTLNHDGSWDELIPPINVSCLEKAFADLEAWARIYPKLDPKPLWTVTEYSGCFMVYGPNGEQKEFCGQGFKSDKQRATKYAKAKNARSNRL